MKINMSIIIWNTYTVCHSKKINTIIPQPYLGSLAYHRKV